MKPILFSTPMVQAILDDRKTKTRRGIKQSFHPDVVRFLFNGEVFIPVDKFDRVMGNGIKCPYGGFKDILWVREKWAARDCDTSNGAVFIEYAATESKRFKYTLTNSVEILLAKIGEKKKWKPSIFMPKEACRLFLKIKSVTIERLQDISQEDAKFEGIDLPCPHRPSSTECKKHADNSLIRDCYVCAFKVLWQQINHNWNDNPWVWVIEFEKVEKP